MANNVFFNPHQVVLSFLETSVHLLSVYLGRWLVLGDLIFFFYMHSNINYEDPLCADMFPWGGGGGGKKEFWIG